MLQRQETRDGKTQGAIGNNQSDNQPQKTECVYIWLLTSIKQNRNLAF